MTDEVEVYLSQEDIDWADENKRTMPNSFDPATQCPLANALWRYFGEKELVAVGITSYGTKGSGWWLGELGSVAQKLRRVWDNGGKIEPGWFTIFPN